MKISCQQTFRSAFRSLWALFSLAAVCTGLQAQTIPPSTVYSSACLSCHGSPLRMGSQPSDPSFPGNYKILGWSALNVTGSAASIAAAMRDPTRLSNDLMRNNYFASISSLNDTQLVELHGYLRAVRDVMVTPSIPAFSATPVDTDSSAQEVRILNLRGAPVNYSFALAGTGAPDFRVVSGSGCTAGGSAVTGSVAAAASYASPSVCALNVFFRPRSTISTAARNDARLVITLTPTAGDAGAAQPSPIELSGTATGLAPPAVPEFTHNGLNALTAFSATRTGSQTMCPTIKNNGTGTLSIDFSVAETAANAGYFELGDSASCPASPPLCLASLPAGSAISGSTNLAFGANSICTLPVRFNPGKFGAASAEGARSATLQIAHNDPGKTPVLEFPMAGVVTAVAQPAIGISTNPAAVSGKVSPPVFAAQVIGSSSAPWIDFSVFNVGTGDELDITAVTQTNPTEFALTESCVSAPPLARTTGGTGPRCAISLRFTPAAIGERCSAVTVRAAISSNGAQTLNVCGTGIAVAAPAMTLSRESIDFGRRPLNGPSPAEQLLIGNAAGASAPLQINAVIVIGSGFTLVPGSTCSGVSVVAGSNCAVQVQFNPDPARPDATYSASLQIDTNSPATPRRTVPLLAVAGGLAILPVLQFTGAPVQLDFPEPVAVGRQSDQVLTLTLRNAGPGSAAIEAVRIVGADGLSFSATGCQEVLAEGASCVINVRFIPGSGGVKRAQLEVVSSQSVAPALLTVTGQGIGATAPFITASASSLSLGTVRVGAQSVPTELRIASAGDGAVRIIAIEAQAPFTVQSKTCPSVPFTLPQGGDCTVTLTFTPTDDRPANALLRVSTDADSKALEIPLSANGQAAADLSSGGCSMVSGSYATDPTLWMLVLLAVAGLLNRQRSRKAERRRP